MNDTKGRIPDWAMDLLERAMPEASWFDLFLISLALWFSLAIVLRLCGVL